MAEPVHTPSRRIYPGLVARRCPECDGELLRAIRLPVDRLVSVYKPVHRYRCQSFDCQWQGRLALESTATAHRNWILHDDGPHLTFLSVLYWTAIGAGLVVVLWTGMVELLPYLLAGAA